MEQSDRILFTDQRSRSIMNAQATKIKESIFAAMDAHAAGTIFIHSAEEGQNFISQLEKNLEEVKR